MKLFCLLISVLFIPFSAFSFPAKNPTLGNGCFGNEKGSCSANEVAVGPGSTGEKLGADLESFQCFDWLCGGRIGKRQSGTWGIGSISECSVAGAFSVLG